MAGINSSQNSFDSYLPQDEWDAFQNMLLTARKVCEKNAKQYGMQIFKDSRWPATGLKSKSWFKQRFIRITLNINYIEDKKVFFQLREHNVISVINIFCKPLSNCVVDELSSDEIMDEHLINNIIQKLIFK